MATTMAMAMATTMATRSSSFLSTRSLFKCNDALLLRQSKANDSGFININQIRSTKTVQKIEAPQQPHVARPFGQRGVWIMWQSLP